MHYADLSAYEHDEDAPDLGRAKNVGWLAAAEPFATSAPVPGLLDALAAYCSVAVSGFRGTYSCELCSEREPDVAFDGRLFVLGSAEIRVLIHHYVAVHHYRPPDVFVEAALSGPRPPSAEYFRRLDALGCHWERARTSSVQVDWERWARGAKTEAEDRRSGGRGARAAFDRELVAAPQPRT